MTKKRTDAPTRPLKAGSVPDALIAFESLGIGKLPTVIGRGLSDYTVLYTELEPMTSARVVEAREQLVAAERTQAADDAEAVSKVARKGVAGFADLVDIIRGEDSVAVAQAEVALAERTHKAVAASTKGTMVYTSTPSPEVVSERRCSTLSGRPTPVS